MTGVWKIAFRIAGEIRVQPPMGPEIVSGSIIFTTSKGEYMGEITVQANETSLRAAITLKDDEDNPTEPDDVPTWEVGDENVLTVNPSDDGMSATFEVGSPGVSSVSVKTTETHGGEGTPTEILMTGVVTVVAGDTVTGSVEFSTG